ncbi:MAG: hypothetical protein ISS78_06370 [Phycisphaerae bacterium]|nr:hypothetical protein [Phycisphaerae bacterium]
MSIEPVGGKHGLRAFIEGRLSSHGANAPQYVAFRDRDFDVEPPDEVKLIPLAGKPIFLTHRACIESYLLDVGLMRTYWTANAGSPGWRHGQPPKTDEIDGLLTTAAKEISPYQAVRWALASIKPGPRWPEVRTTWTDGSGDLPTSLDYESCLGEAEGLVGSSRANTDGVTVELLKERATAYKVRFEIDAFWGERRYLVWFHGKDLLRSMQRKLPISLKHFCEWATGNVDWKDHEDLVELAGKVN